MSSERQLLNPKDPWWGEHVHRYQEVLPYLGHSDLVLDLACGTGFGSSMIASKTTGMVTGGDISEEALEECDKNWKSPNLQFLKIDATKIPFPDNYFDVLVSFETIEHSTKYHAIVQEFYRVLKPGSRAFISTPNFPVNSPSGKVTNPYHTQEFTYNELKSLLIAVFPEVEIMGQKFNRPRRGVRGFAGRLIYWLFNLRGLRKIAPHSVKNGLSKFFSGHSFYPVPDEFKMTTNHSEILRCKTFFCVCRK